MNLSIPIGLAIGIGVILFDVFSGVKNPMIYANWHGIAIVVGGTFAAALICFSFEQLGNISKVFFKSFIGTDRKETLDTIQEVVAISEHTFRGGKISDQLQNINNHFLRESLQLAEQDVLTPDELEDVLMKRLSFQNDRYKRESNTFRIIGKFPPAYGLIGATMGMIALLQGLAEPDSFTSIGPAMSVALTATFYGLILANLVLIPFGENLTQASMDDLLRRKIVIDGVKLIQEKKHPVLVKEFLYSYLTPYDRNMIQA